MSDLRLERSSTPKQLHTELARRDTTHLQSGRYSALYYPWPTTQTFCTVPAIRISSLYPCCLCQPQQ